MYIGFSKSDDMNLTLSRFFLGLKLGLEPFSLSKRKNDPLSILLKVYDDGLKGRLPQSFFLAPIDPGRGKSSASIAYIRAWKASGFIGEESILIALFTIEEIKDYIKECDLDNSYYAVMVGFNEPINKMGRGDLGRDGARILFTTHNMLLTRSSVSGFEGAKDFFYKGKPRTLRIWDEGVDAARSVSVHVEGLMAAVEPAREISDQFADALLDFLQTLLKVPLGTILEIPVLPKLRGLSRQDSDSSNADGAPKLSKGHRAALRSLCDLAGMKARIGKSGKRRVLYGYGKPLPPDLAPMIISDASARLRGTYKAWRESRSDLIVLPALVTNYCNLKIHLAVQGTGKELLRDPVQRDFLLRSLAKLIDTRPNERWLIVHPLVPGFNMTADMQARVAIPANVKATHWGLHKATNGFSKFENVIVIGPGFYKEVDYKTMLAAAEGATLDANDEDKRWTDVRRGELAANLLQAVCRINARNVIEGICGKAAAYIILSKSPDPRKLLTAAFPGAPIHDWELQKQELSGRAKQAADQVLTMLRSAPRVPKKEVAAALGMSSQQLTPIWKKPLFIAYLRERGVKYAGKSFIRIR